MSRPKEIRVQPREIWVPDSALSKRTVEMLIAWGMDVPSDLRARFGIEESTPT